MGPTFYYVILQVLNIEINGELRAKSDAVMLAKGEGFNFQTADRITEYIGLEFNYCVIEMVIVVDLLS